MNKSGTEWVALTLLPSARMVDRRRGRDSFEESLERSLDKGVSLPAPDRLVAMTTRNGGARLGIVVSMPQRPAGQYIERRKGGPASRRYECRVASCRARGPSPSVLPHSPKCEYWRSLLLLRGQASGAGEQLQAARWADAVRPRDDRSLAGAV